MGVEDLAVKYQERESDRETVRILVFTSLSLNPSFPATKLMGRNIEREICAYLFLEVKMKSLWLARYVCYYEAANRATERAFSGKYCQLAVSGT